MVNLEITVGLNVKTDSENSLFPQTSLGNHISCGFRFDDVIVGFCSYCGFYHYAWGFPESTLGFAGLCVGVFDVANALDTLVLTLGSAPTLFISNVM